MIIPNSPDIWLSALPRPTASGHKYHRGHAVILGASTLTGATRLAAAACSRIGAGLVTVLGGEASDVYRKTLPADIMVPDGKLSDVSKVTAVLAGPGGVSEDFKTQLLEICEHHPTVLDADAMFHRGTPPYENPIILTPHEGEFERLFPDLGGDRTSRAHEAARISGLIVVLKGPETLIAAPDGTMIQNSHATPWLAKAGTGDVLAGFIVGLLAQGMSPAYAAAAAVWIHGEAGRRQGPGLVASDLPEHVPAILKDLLEGSP